MRARVLLADNSPDYRRFLRLALEQEGYQVEEAASVEEAREKFAAVFVDLTIVDLRLINDEDTYDFSGLNDVAKLASKLDIPCILIDASPTVEITRQALRSVYGRPLAINVVVKKQDDPQAILEAIKDVPSLHFKGSPTRILHLSDIHLGTTDHAAQYRIQLETDLIQELKISQLDYLVISGDVGTNSTQGEYDAAVDLVNGIVRRFRLNSTRIVVVPGNHDASWDLSEKAYCNYRRKLPDGVPEGCYILLGDLGVLLCDAEVYKQRFANLNYFYGRVCNGEYPLNYVDQAILHPYPESRILFLALNSAWQVDHYFTARSGINRDALTKALGKLLDAGDNYKGWLKIAIWHHPVRGPDQMKNTQFLQQLSCHDFQIVMCGHIHEAEHDLYHYHEEKWGIHIVGAGTFGAPTRQQVPGIPLQYNLLTLDPTTGKIIVETRKKDKPDGAWSADARWGDLNNPVPRYEIMVKPWVVSR